MIKRGPKVKNYSPETELIFKCVGKTIREIRKEMGYSSHETFAHNINIARAQYLSYEHGRNIQLHSLFKLLRAVKVKPSVFFERVEAELKAYGAEIPEWSDLP